eukprot:1465186-Prorocentrum_lima.AAC.1
MTSSLVGSEMCIRDSCWVARLTGGPLCRHLPSRQSFFDREDPQSQRPVSYTHLTLPTICSV